jgi:hypothetical protein
MPGEIEFLDQMLGEFGPDIREEGTGAIEDGVILGNEALDVRGLLTASGKEKYG